MCAFCCIKAISTHILILCLSKRQTSLKSISFSPKHNTLFMLSQSLAFISGEITRKQSVSHRMMTSLAVLQDDRQTQWKVHSSCMLPFGESAQDIIQILSM